MRSLLLLIPCVLLAVAAPHFAATPLPAVVKTSHPGGNRSASATPLWDARGFAWYLTCKHCLPVATVGGQQVLYAFPHPTQDLALLKVRGSVGVGSQLGAAPALGDRLVAMGYGLGVSLQVTDGRAGDKPGRMTCSSIFGCSGGAVLNADGKLVGIISQLAYMSNGFIYIPVTHISYYEPIPKDWLLAKTGV